MLATASRAADAGRWAEAAARLEAWAERLAEAVNAANVSTPAAMDEDARAAARRIVGCAGRMYGMAVNAANHAWARAASAGGARA
jgi:hypothetical protein